MSDFNKEFAAAHGASPSLVTAAILVHESGLEGDEEAFGSYLNALRAELEKSSGQ